jgi:LPS sulfotransferase NodH
MILTEPNKLIIVAFVPRSGSNYLCDMLHRCGDLGTLMEYYFPYDFAERIIDWDSRTNEFERINKKRITNELSWFLQVLQRGGLKCTWHSHQKMIEEVGDILTTIETKYIYLRRRDKLRQAISWYRANINQQWTSKIRKERPDPPYDKKEIEKRLGYIEFDEQHWGEFFRNKEHLELFYEDLNYETVKQYEAYTGLKRKRERSLDSEYTIQRDKLTEEWVEKYVNPHNS